MSEIILLCGLPGSGKSTWAKARAAQGAMAFSTDQWMLRLYGPHMPRELFDARLAVCSDLLYEQALRLAALGVDVVIEGAFWKREDRRIAIERLKPSGARLRLVWFDVPHEELLRRLAKRNAALPADTFEITPEMFGVFAGWFAPPGADEGFELEVVR